MITHLYYDISITLTFLINGSNYVDVTKIFLLFAIFPDWERAFANPSYFLEFGTSHALLAAQCRNLTGLGSV
jgi:hypothetical protein